MSGETLGAVFVASLIATAGVWWFRLVMPAIKKTTKPVRFLVYVSLWLAYFVLIWMLIEAQA